MWFKPGEVVVWLLPHPDDGIIGWGDSIYQSVLTGNTNFFVYFTKGENSLARLRIVGLDGSRYTLSRKEFGEARCREVLAALGVLGVTCEQVTFFWIIPMVRSPLKLRQTLFGTTPPFIRGVL